MSEDSKSGGHDANSGRQTKLSAGFNKGVDLGAQIAALSPEAKMQVQVFQEASAQRLADEKRAQQRSHEHRVLRATVEAFEAHIRDPSPRPDEVRANPSQDIDLMKQGAEDLVRRREEYYLKRIEQEAAANIQQVIDNDHKGLTPRRDQLEHGHE